MDVVPATGLAVHNGFFVRVKAVVTDGALSLDRFAVSVLLFFAVLLAFILDAWYGRCVAEQIAKLRAEEGQLISHMLWRFQNTHHHVYDVFALISFVSMWAVASRNDSNVHSVHVACGPNNYHLLFRYLFTSMSFSREYREALRESSILNRHIGSWWMRSESAKALLFGRGIIVTLGLLQALLW